MKEITVTAKTEAEAHDLLAAAWNDNDNKPVKKTGKNRGFLLRAFGFLVLVLAKVIATPIYIVLWVLNFVKFSVGSFIFYVVGKFILFGIVPIFVLGALSYFKLVSEEQALNMTNASMTFAFNAPLGVGADVKLFPYEMVELYIVFGMAAITATVATFGKLDKD